MRRLSLAFLIGALACGHESTKPVIIDGTYQLESVINAALPTTIVSDTASGYSLIIRAGAFAVRSDATFSSTLTREELVHGVSTVSTVNCDGRYTHSGQTLLFIEAVSTNCGSSYVGSWDGGNTMKVTYDPQTVAVFRR